MENNLTMRVKAFVVKNNAKDVEVTEISINPLSIAFMGSDLNGNTEISMLKGTFKSPEPFEQLEKRWNEALIRFAGGVQ